MDSATFHLSSEQRAKLTKILGGSVVVEHFVDGIQESLPADRLARFLQEHEAGASAVHGAEEATHTAKPSIAEQHMHKAGASAVHGAEEVLGSAVKEATHTAKPSIAEQHMHKEQEGHEDHGHGFPVFAFLFFTLSCGCLLQVVQERFLQCMPYTMLLFLMGFAVAASHQLNEDVQKHTWPTWFKSIHMWEEIDPHAVFYVFLPVLLFADAMKMNMKLFSKVIMQVLLLAAPGVVIGTVLTGVFAQNVLPYGWDWQLAMLFGAIMAATDPVAVVALFNTLGVSPRLTMLISGESLLNDGTAIIAFELMMELVKKEVVLNNGGEEHSGSHQTHGEEVLNFEYVTGFGVRVVLGACALGLGLSFVANLLIYTTAKTLYHSDAMIQVLVTICCAYLCFFLAESEAKASGVLTVVTAGAIFSYMSWPRFASRETIHIVWEAIEFLGNTIIFTLAGLLFGDRCMSSSANHDLVAGDIGWLLVLYFAAMAIRFIMIVFLWPLLNVAGADNVTLPEVIVMTWSGLRGAVGLVLAIRVDLEAEDSTYISEKDGARFMFYVGGVAMLTTCFNAPLTAPLLRHLKMTDASNAEEIQLEFLEDEVDKACRNTYREIITAAETSKEYRFRNVDEDDVLTLLPFLGDEKRPSSKKHIASPATHTVETTKLCREIFLRVVQKFYWSDIETGVIAPTSRVASYLLWSAQDGLEDLNNAFHDWDVLAENFGPSTAWDRMNKIVRCVWPLRRSGFLLETFPNHDVVLLQKVYVALSYVRAHSKAQAKLKETFPGNKVFRHEVKEAVCAESQSQIDVALAVIQGLPKDKVEYAKSKMLASMLIHEQMQEVGKMKEEGFLSSSGASCWLHHLEDQQRNVAAKHIGTDDDDSEELIGDQTFLFTPRGAALPRIGTRDKVMVPEQR